MIKPAPQINIENIRRLLREMTAELGVSGQSCTHEKHLEKAIRNTINDLDRTKSTFKSKQIAEIREKLISALNN